MDGIEIIFASLQQQQIFGVFAQYLPTQLGTYRAASSADQYCLLKKILCQKRGIRRDRIASKQLFDLKLAQVIYRDPTVRKISHARKSADACMTATHAVDNLVSPLTRC